MAKPNLLFDEFKTYINTPNLRQIGIEQITYDEYCINIKTIILMYNIMIKETLIRIKSNYDLSFSANDLLYHNNTFTASQIDELLNEIQKFNCCGFFTCVKNNESKQLKYKLNSLDTLNF